MRERYQLQQWLRKADSARRKIWALREDMPDEGELHDAIMDAQMAMEAGAVIAGSRSSTVAADLFQR